jgi:hypothetical protein
MSNPKSPESDVAALVGELRTLATPERAKHGVPQDVAMLKAAETLESLSSKVKEAGELGAVAEDIYTFGHGKLVIEGGLYGGKHAVFIYPAKEPGEVNTSAAREDRPADSLIEGEIVLTFPTEAQVDYVMDALYNRARGSGFKDDALLPAAALKGEAMAWQEIATAPKDGKPFEALYDDATTERDVYWAQTRQCILGSRAGERGPGCMSTEVGLPVDPISWRPQGEAVAGDDIVARLTLGFVDKCWRELCERNEREGRRPHATMCLISDEELREFMERARSER